MPERPLRSHCTGVARDDAIDEVVVTQDPRFGMHLEAEQVGLGARIGVGPEQVALDLDDPLGDDRLDSDIEAAGGAERIDARFDQAEIFVEHGILQRDRERQQPVEPALDRRHILLQAAAGLVDQDQP